MGTRTAEITVVHVDDDRDFLELSVTSLEQVRDHIRVEAVTSVSEAHWLIETNGVDCVLANYDMPETDGLEFLETVRERHPDLPFILVTGMGSEAIASEAISAGVTDYLQKRNGTAQFEVLANRIENAVEQYRASKNAERSQQYLRELTENATDCLWMFDSDWEELLFINSAYEDVWGRPVSWVREDPLDFVDSIHPDDREDVREAMDQLSAGEKMNIEYRIHPGTTSDPPTDDEEVRWLWDTGVPVFGNDGDVARVVGFTRDITERKRTEERLQAFVEGSSDVLGIVDENGRFRELSPSMERVLGYEPAEVEGDWVFDYVHPDDKEDLLGEFQAMVETGETTRGEYRIKHADGSWHWVESIGTARFATTIDGFVVTTRSIHERKQYERTLAELHAAVREIMTSDTIDELCQHTVDAAQEVLDLDQSVVALEEDGYLHVKAISADVPEDGATTMSVEEGIAGKTYRTGKTFLIDDFRNYEDALPQDDYRAGISVPLGEYGNFQAVSAEIGAFDEQDKELAELLISQAEAALDRLQHEQDLERRNERLDEFASFVSHDLRNPLNVAGGYLELAREECDSEHLDVVARNHDRMESLIEDLLSLARQETSVTDLETLSLAGQADGCWRSVETEGATLDVAGDREIRADPNRLQQLLENLFRNAAEHGGEVISVGTLPDGFYVADDGAGIPDDEREAIFEPGYSTSESGTGLGLYIVETIADDHGWEIDVRESDAGGARFEVRGVE